MKIKVFEFDKNGKISFTKNELEKLLNEVYDSGYDDGKRSSNYWTWTSPYKWDTITCGIATNATINPTPTLNPNTIKYEPTYEPYAISTTKANINMGEVHNTIGD